MMTKMSAYSPKSLSKGAIVYEACHTCKYTVEIPGENIGEVTKFVEKVIKEKTLLLDITNSVVTSEIAGSKNVKFTVVSETSREPLVELMQDHMIIIGKAIEKEYFPVDATLRKD